MRSLFASAIVIAIITAAVFGQVRAHEFVLYDDGVHVFDNPNISQGFSKESIRWAFTTTYFGNWFPVTWLSYLTDSSLYGLNASGYHLTNLLIHIANALLILFLLSELTSAVLPAFIMALVFAVHPMNVEPVVWISSRKDLLCLFFWLLTVLSYQAYTLKPKASLYALVSCTILLSLMSKGMAITLPFVLILMDIWSQRRWDKSQNGLSLSYLFEQKKLLLEKIPWFIMTGIFMVINFSAQDELGNTVIRQATSLKVGIGHAVANYVLYLEKYIWPTQLTPHYPKSNFEFPTREFIIGVVVLSLITTICIKVRKRMPALLFGWCLFLGVLVPVGGLVPIGENSIAERYLYIPQIGLLIGGSFLLQPLFKRSSLGATATMVLAAVTISVLSYASWQQTARWKNSITLFTYMLSVNPNSVLAHTNLGISLIENPETRQQGIHHLIRVVDKYEVDGALPTQMSMAYNNLATAYMADEQFREAIPILNRAIQADPNSNNLAVYNNLGWSHFKLNNYTQAKQYCQHSLKLAPDDPKANQLLKEIESQLR